MNAYHPVALHHARWYAWPGKLWFKVVQACERGLIEWVEIPQPGQTAHDRKRPAAELEILPAAEPAHHH